MVALNDTSWLSNWATNLGMIEKKKIQNYIHSPNKLSTAENTAKISTGQAVNIFCWTTFCQTCLLNAFSEGVINRLQTIYRFASSKFSCNLAHSGYNQKFFYTNTLHSWRQVWHHFGYFNKTLFYHNCAIKTIVKTAHQTYNCSSL